MSNCRSCGAEVLWVVMESGAKMICNPKELSFVVLGQFDKGKTYRGYEPHWATCPDAKEWRKRNFAQREPEKEPAETP